MDLNILSIYFDITKVIIFQCNLLFYKKNL